MQALHHKGCTAAHPGGPGLAPNACMLRRRIRARAAECITFDVGSPPESRRLRTLTQSLQLDGLPVPSGSGGPSERSAAARAAAAAAAALAASPPAHGEEEGAAAAVSGAAGATTSSGSDSEEESHLISREFKECRCAQDVLDVISDEISHMSTHNTVTALGRLAALTKRMHAGERAAVLSAPAFVSALQLLARQVPAMSPFQLVNALYSAAVMGAPLTKVPSLMAAADEAVARMAPDFNARDVCSSLYAYALLRHAKPAHGAGALLLARAQSLLDTGGLEPRGVSMLLWAAGSLGMRHAGLCSAATRALLASDGAMLRDMTSQGVANCVWGLAKANGGAVDSGLLDRALAALAAAGDDCKPQEVLNTLWACARCRHDPGAHWSPLLAYCTRHAGALAPADVSSLFHALGVFGRLPEPDAMRALGPRAAELLPRMSPLEACTLYRGLGLAGAFEAPVWRDLTLEAIPAAWRAGRLDAAAKRMAFQGFLAGRVEGAEETLPGDALLDFKSAWDEGLAARARVGARGGGTRGGGGGSFGWEVHSLLEQLGVRHDTDVLTRDGLSVVDVQLRAGGGRWVALQLAGEHEFASNGGRRLGAAALQQALLEKAGYEVRWMAVHDFAGKPPHRRPLYMVELLRALGVGVPKAAESWAEEVAAGGPAAAAAAARGGARRGRGGGAAGGSSGDRDRDGPVRASEAELLFRDPKVSGGRRGGGGSSGGRRRTGGGGGARRR